MHIVPLWLDVRRKPAESLGVDSLHVASEPHVVVEPQPIEYEPISASRLAQQDRFGAYRFVNRRAGG